MMTFEWNALRIGDRVAVHGNDADASAALTAGVVSIVQTRPVSNEITVHIDSADGPHSVIRPRRLTVHTVPLDPNESCWRCDAIAALAPTTITARGHVDAQ